MPIDIPFRYLDQAAARNLAGGQAACLRMEHILSREHLALAVGDARAGAWAHMRREMASAVAEAMALAKTAVVSWSEIEREVALFSESGSALPAFGLGLYLECWITPRKESPQ